MRYLREMRAYWRDCRTPLDFLRLMQVRLSLSKVGWLTTPRHRIIRRVDMRSFGGPVYLRSHTTDIGALREQLIGDVYAPIGRQAKSVHTILDLGANIGLAARRLLAEHPDAAVVCVEPDPGNVRMLHRNLGAAGDAKIVAACVGATERLVTLDECDGEWGFQMRDAPDGTIPVVTMQTLLELLNGRADVLKCDIEGAEVEVFQDAAWMDRVGVAIVECHGFPAEDILPSGWRVAEREANTARPGFETATLVPASTAG